MNKFKYIPLFAIVFCALLPWNATAVNQETLSKRLFTQHFKSGVGIEGQLVKTLIEIKQGQLNDALNTINNLIQTTPNFKLAYAIRGDLLAAKTGALSHFADAKSGENGQIDELKQEAEVRLKSYFESNKNKLQPNLLIKLNRQQRYVLVLDVTKSRLFLYAKDNDDHLEYVADYYVTIGKLGFDKRVQGDKRTPLGVYFASAKLNQQLPDLYGTGAYPLNYPNEIDQYEKRNGNGIWLHGTPSYTYSRAPRASDGCIVLSNPDLDSLKPILSKGGTPVIIANNLRWVKEDAIEKQINQQQELENALEAWRQDWVKLDTNQYLSHYSKQFFYDKGNFNSWAEYKTNVQSNKVKVIIDISNVSMFTYPTARKPMVVVNFDQYFKSPTLVNKMRKRQYWINENNQWKIIYEGAG